MNTPENIKSAVRSRLLSVPFFSNVPIVLDTEANTDGALDRAIKTAIDSGAGAGVFGIVTIPTARDSMPNPEAPLSYMVSVQFYEDPLVNRTNGGTGKYAETLASQAYVTLKHFEWRDGNPASGGAGCLICLPVPEPVSWLKDAKARWAYQCRFEVQSLQQDYLGLCAEPFIVVADGVATITCATPGAALYVTLDGTYPSAAAGAALYAGPFSVTAGQAVLACAYLPTFIPSIVKSYTV